jgi:hypothetical protein
MNAIVDVETKDDPDDVRTEARQKAAVFVEEILTLTLADHEEAVTAIDRLLLGVGEASPYLLIKFAKAARYHERSELSRIVRVCRSMPQFETIDDFLHAHLVGVGSSNGAA